MDKLRGKPEYRRNHKKLAQGPDLATSLVVLPGVDGTAIHEYNFVLAENVPKIKMPEPTISKLPELVIFGGPLPKFQFPPVSAAIFYENVITGNIWPRVHGEL